MKAIIIALITAYAGAPERNLTATNVQQNIVVEIRQDRTPVKPEDLPDAVKATLGGEAYSGWEVTGAFLITKEDKSQYFEVILKKAEETATINLDKDGKKVD